jgi:hypothetical protein
MWEAVLSFDQNTFTYTGIQWAQIVCMWLFVETIPLFFFQDANAMWALPIVSQG